MDDKCENHPKSDSYRDILMLKEFINLEKDQTEDMAQYVNRRAALYKKIQTAGFNFENKVLMGLMLIGLPMEYEYLWTSVQIHDDYWTPASLEIRLTKEEGRLKKSKSDESPCNSNIDPPIKTEEMEFNLEDLHHSIMIKDEDTSEFQPEKEPEISTKQKQFICEFCEYKCVQKGDLKRHLRIHTGEKPYICEVCGHKFAQRNTLKFHLQTHTGDKPFKCTVCEYKFAAKRSLNDHLRIHSGDKPFSCELCDFKSGRKGQVALHLRTHTGEKPFKCTICDKTYPHKNSLKVHLRTHTGEKPFTCSICGYKCAQSGQFKYHLRTHTGEKPFSCGICNYKCKRRVALTKHLRTHDDDR